MLTAMLLVLGCDSGQHAEEPELAALPVGQWANVAPAEVLEVTALEGRRYAKVQEAHWHFWVQLDPKVEVQAGDFLLLGTGALQQKVKLGERTLNEVLLIDEVAVVDRETAEAVLVLPTIAAETVAIEALYAHREQLAGQEISVAGRVVKTSLGIFDTNWYHLRDGTGSKESNDFTFTSDVELQVGEVVVASGVLTIDKDLGFGYFYPVIIEGASVETADGAPLHPGAEPQTSVAPPPEQPALRESQGPTPVNAIYGLEFGLADHRAIERWLDDRGLDCDGSRALARTAFHYECRGDLPLSVLPDRSIGGKLHTLLIARPDEGAMHHFSTVRDHALKADALTDYTTSVESLTKVLGTPLRSSMPLPESKLDAALVWFSSVWSFDELEVQLSLLRMGGDGPLSVRERWYQPEAAAARASRGLSPHGGPVRSASNPHIAGTK